LREEIDEYLNLLQRLANLTIAKEFLSRVVHHLKERGCQRRNDCGVLWTLNRRIESFISLFKPGKDVNSELCSSEIPDHTSIKPPIYEFTWNIHEH